MYYYRPVSRVALFEAAVAGLYETARLPIPHEVQNATRRLQADPQRAEDQLLELLAAAREQLGRHEALRGSNAVRASLRALPRALDQYSVPVAPNNSPYLEVREDVASAGLEFVGLPSPPAMNGLGIGAGFARDDIPV